MRFEMGEGCVALRSLCAVSSRASGAQVGAGKGSRYSSFKAHYKLSTSILWTASFLLSRVLLGGYLLTYSGGVEVENSRYHTRISSLASPAGPSLPLTRCTAALPAP